MIKSLIDEHEELLSSMDWSFLPPEKSKEPWPETRHAILLGSSIIVQYDWNCYLWHYWFFVVFLCVFSSVYMALYLCSVLTNFWPKDIRVFKCEILLKMLNSGHCQKKKKRRNMIAILCLVNVFSELCLKDILRWNLYTGKRLIRSFPTTFLREAV